MPLKTSEQYQPFLSSLNVLSSELVSYNLICLCSMMKIVLLYFQNHSLEIYIVSTLIVQ